MNEFRIFRRLIEVYARATMKPVSVVCHPNGKIQVVGEGINLSIALEEERLWITKIGQEVFRNLERKMKESVPDNTEIITSDK